MKRDDKRLDERVVVWREVEIVLEAVRLRVSSVAGNVRPSADAIRRAELFTYKLDLSSEENMYMKRRRGRIRASSLRLSRTSSSFSASFAISSSTAMTLDRDSLSLSDFASMTKKFGTRFR